MEKEERWELEKVSGDLRKLNGFRILDLGMVTPYQSVLPVAGCAVLTAACIRQRPNCGFRSDGVARCDSPMEGAVLVGETCVLLDCCIAASAFRIQGVSIFICLSIYRPTAVGSFKNFFVATIFVALQERFADINRTGCRFSLFRRQCEVDALLPPSVFTWFA